MPSENDRLVALLLSELAATRQQERDEDDGRGVALAQLEVVTDFLNAVSPDVTTHNPLQRLWMAVGDLDRGAQAPMLKPKRMKKGGTPPLTTEALATRALAAAFMDALMGQMKKRDAARKVGRLLNGQGAPEFKNLNPRQMEKWRDRAMSGSKDDVDAELYCAVKAHIREYPGTLEDAVSGILKTPFWR